MRIAFILLGDLGLTSGGFLYDRMMLDGLRARGHDIDVVSLPWPDYGAQIALNFSRIGWPRAGSEFDLVLEDELAHPALLAANLRLRARGIPVVALVHNLTWRQPRVHRPTIKRIVESAYLRNVDGAVCVCEDTRRDVAKSLSPRALSGLAYAGRDHVIPRLSEAEVRARARESGPLRIAMLCNVSAHKGVHRVLAAMALRRAGDLELHVIGSLADAPYVAEQRRFVSAHDLESRVHWYGELHGDALWQSLASFHVLALPSDREAFPLAAIEALSAGMPVLATRLGGTGELIADRIEGRLLAPDDIEALADALSEVALDRVLLECMSLAALRRYHAQGTWAQTAQAVETLLYQVSRRHTPRRPWFR